MSATGPLKKETNPAPGVIQTKMASFCEEMKDYVSGGVTYNYSPGLFSGAPNVKVGIQLKNLAYSSGLIVSPVITANTTTQTTVRVNVGTTSSVAEAATDDVIVHLFATM